MWYNDLKAYACKINYSLNVYIPYIGFDDCAAWRLGLSESWKQARAKITRILWLCFWTSTKNSENVEVNHSDLFANGAAKTQAMQQLDAKIHSLSDDRGFTWISSIITVRQQKAALCAAQWRLANRTPLGSIRESIGSGAAGAGGAQVPHRSHHFSKWWDTHVKKPLVPHHF